MNKERNTGKKRVDIFSFCSKTFHKNVRHCPETSLERQIEKCVWENVLMLKVKDLKYYKLNVSDNLFLKNSDQDLSSLHRLNVRIGLFFVRLSS